MFFFKELAKPSFYPVIRLYQAYFRIPDGKNYHQLQMVQAVASCCCLGGSFKGGGNCRERKPGGSSSPFSEMDIVRCEPSRGHG